MINCNGGHVWGTNVPMYHPHRQISIETPLITTWSHKRGIPYQSCLDHLLGKGKVLEMCLTTLLASITPSSFVSSVPLNRIGCRSPGAFEVPSVMGAPLHSSLWHASVWRNHTILQDWLQPPVSLLPPEVGHWGPAAFPVPSICLHI
jgi:hypothetical protein